MIGAEVETVHAAFAAAVRRKLILEIAGGVPPRYAAR